MSIQFTNNTQLYISTVSTGHTVDNTFKVPLTSGYSLNQTKNTLHIQLEEAAGLQGSDAINTAINPVDFSITILTRPFVKDTFVKPIDFLLWEALLSGTMPDSISSGFLGTTNRQALTPVFIYFVNDNDVYLLEYSYIESAEVTINIKDICTTTWVGKAIALKRNQTIPALYTDVLDAPILSDSEAFLKNHLTTALIQDNDSSNKYNIPITGGSVTINNNLQILTPNYLSIVNKPIGNVVGTKTVSGKLDTIARFGTPAAGFRTTEDLLFDILESEKVRDRYNIQIAVGGIALRPRLVITSPNAFINVPNISNTGLTSLSLSFNSLGTDIESSDELTLGIYANTTGYVNNNHTVLNSTATSFTVSSEILSGDGVSYLVGDSILNSSGSTISWTIT